MTNPLICETYHNNPLLQEVYTSTITFADWNRIGREFCNQISVITAKGQREEITEQEYYKQLDELNAHYQEVCDRYHAQDDMSEEYRLRQQELKLEQEN